MQISSKIKWKQQQQQAAKLTEMKSLNGHYLLRFSRTYDMSAFSHHHNTMTAVDGDDDDDDDKNHNNKNNDGSTSQNVIILGAFVLNRAIKMISWSVVQMCVA